MGKYKMKILLKSLVLLSLFTSTAFAAIAPMRGLPAQPEYILTIKDHIFSPAELKVPAGKKVKIVIDNQDTTPEEFESHDLNREKVVPAHSKGTVFVGPLKAGSYKYVGEFNESTANGTITAE
jgi:hypothetical protein